MRNLFFNFKIQSGVLVLAIIALITTFLSFPYLSNDCGYYLNVMRDLYNGNIYFKDIAIPYNPLGILILSLPKLLIESPDSRLHLLINFAAILTSTILLLKLLNTLSPNRKVNRFLSLLFLALCLIYDGAFLMLEPISILFQLLALKFYLTFRVTLNLKKIYLVGLFLGLGFLTKQYALFLLLPIGVDLLLKGKYAIKSIAILSIGVMTPILLLYFYYAFHDTSSIQYLNYILGKGVDLDIGNGTGIKEKLNTTGLINFLICSIFIALTPTLIKKLKPNLSDKIFFILLPISALSVFLFATYYHYFQYLFPYTLILFAFALNKNALTLNKYLLPSAFLISSLMVIALSVKSVTGQKKYFERQAYNEKLLKEVIPEKSKVYLSGIRPAFYYLGDFNSIKLDKIGYSFPGYFYPETVIKYMDKDSYLVLTEDYLKDYSMYLELFNQQIIEFRKGKQDTRPVYILRKK